MRNKERVINEMDNQLRLIKSIIKGLQGKDLSPEQILERLRQVQKIGEFVVSQVQTE